MSNLRLADRSLNMANTTAYRNNKSGLKGAYRSGNRWRSTIRHHRQTIYLGMFESAEAAHAAYAAKARELRGEFARAK
jgi:hypothetical protein